MNIQHSSRRRSVGCSLCGTTRTHENTGPNRRMYDGLESRCRACASKMSAKSNRKRAENRIFSKSFAHRKASSKKKGMTFSITEDMFEEPFCECCGVEVFPGKERYSPTSPTLDRIDNTHGYTPENTAILCWSCNDLKGSNTLDTLEMIRNYMEHALLTNSSSEWYTPPDVAHKVHKVLGGVGFDPASCAAANGVVRADSYSTNGLLEEWPSGVSVFLNPPTKRITKHWASQLFWAKLMEHRDRFTHAIYLAYSLEQLSSLQNAPCKESIGDFPFCIPRRRIRFLREDLSPSKSPSHSNAIVYVPGTIDRRDLFAEVFRSEGVVIGL